MNYYNEFDKFAANWLRELIAEGLIPDGHVDERDIREVRPSDLDGYVQCHFFAGIGGWPYALRLAGWPDDRPVWSGSCPCQPFSVAGKGGGLDDERHLWPAFRWLIAKSRPKQIFGEQVASKDGREWLTGVRVDLEILGYQVGAADLCAAGVGAPHIRQRLFWVANAGRIQRPKKRGEFSTSAIVGEKRETDPSAPSGENGDAGLEDPSRSRPRNNNRPPCGQGRKPVGAGAEGIRQGNWKACPNRVDADGGDCGVAQPKEQRKRELEYGNGRELLKQDTEDRVSLQLGRSGCVDWTTSVWWPCRDGKARRVPGRWVGNTSGMGLPGDNGWRTGQEPENGCEDGGMADTGLERQQPLKNAEHSGVCGEMVSKGEQRKQPCDNGAEERATERLIETQPLFQLIFDGLSTDLGSDGYQSVLEALNCFPLSGPVPGRVGLLKGAGNAIIPKLGAEFIKAYLEAT